MLILNKVFFCKGKYFPIRKFNFDKDNYLMTQISLNVQSLDWIRIPSYFNISVNKFVADIYISIKQ